MRILVATANRFLMGGADHYVHSLLPALAARGHQLALIYEVSVEPGVATVDETVPGIPAWPAGGAQRDSALRAVTAWGPDVVYSHGLADGGLEDALTRRYSTVLFAHNYYGTCAT